MELKEPKLLNHDLDVAPLRRQDVATQDSTDSGDLCGGSLKKARRTPGDAFKKTWALRPVT